MAITKIQTAIKIASSKGFSLLELMITLSITAILMSVGVPAYQSVMTQSRLTAQANELVTSLHYARSEAVKRGVRVTICPSNGGANCTINAWENGWLVFSDSDGSGSINGADEVLRVFPALPGSTLGDGGSFSNGLSYRSNGRGEKIGGALVIGTFTLCSNNQGRTITLNITGRPRVNKVPSC